MKNYIQALHSYLSNNEGLTGHCNARSLLDMLSCCFMQNHNMETQEVRTAFRQMDMILEKLSLGEQNAFFDRVCKILSECQKKAFREGIRIGFCLHEELNEQKDGQP